jgi:flagellar basal-body rod protein FlgG
MTCMETKLDVIANNLANMETTAFKCDRANFEDLFYQYEKYPGGQDSAGEYAPTGTAIGMGVQTQSTQANFSQGAFRETGRELDLAIEGRGFFQVLNPGDGSTLYTRAGNLTINSNNNLVIGSASTGRLIQPPISIPEDTLKIVVSPDGIISVQQPGNNNLSQVGQIELATFVNAQGLVKMGENLYAESDASGAPNLGNPGQEQFGTIRQNMLEASNTEPVQELIDLITTQRAFEMNSQVIKTGDEIMQNIANLRRY